MASTGSLSDSFLHSQWLYWSCIRRLDEISSHILRDGEQVVEVDEAIFRQGIALEASWLSVMVGWATTRRVKLLPEVAELYAQLIGASEGIVPMRDILFDSNELQKRKDRVRITRLEEYELEELEKDFQKSFKRPAEWWRTLTGSFKRGDVFDKHIDCMLALEYARTHADFGQAVVDERAEVLRRTLDNAQSLLAALEVDQEGQLNDLSRLRSDDEHELLKVFIAAYPQAQLTEDERRTLEGRSG